MRACICYVNLYIIFYVNFYSTHFTSPLDKHPLMKRRKVEPQTVNQSVTVGHVTTCRRRATPPVKSGHEFRFVPLIGLPRQLFFAKLR